MNMKKNFIKVTLILGSQLINVGSMFAAYVSFFPCGDIRLQVGYGTKSQSFNALKIWDVCNQPNADNNPKCWDTWRDFGVVGKTLLVPGQWNTLSHPNLTIYDVKLYDMQGNEVAKVLDWLYPHSGAGRDEKFFFVYQDADGKVKVEETSRYVFENPLEAQTTCRGRTAK